MSDFSIDEVRVLKALAAGLINATSSGSGQPAASSGGDALPDAQLDKDWADKVVSKDPKRWNGDSMVGQRYSACSAEWHDCAAGFSQWKAEQGRKENPPRLKNNGKPWYESDEFDAKLHRAWARRIRERGNPTQAAVDATTPAEDAQDLPF